MCAPPSIYLRSSLMLSFHLSLFFLSVGAATGSSLAGWLAGCWEGNNIKDMARRPDNGRYVNDLIRCSGPLVSNAASLWPPAFCAHGTRERQHSHTHTAAVGNGNGGSRFCVFDSNLMRRNIQPVRLD